MYDKVTVVGFNGYIYVDKFINKIKVLCLFASLNISMKYGVDRIDDDDDQYV